MSYTFFMYDPVFPNTMPMTAKRYELLCCSCYFSTTK